MAENLLLPDCQLLRSFSGFAQLGSDSSVWVIGVRLPASLTLDLLPFLVVFVADQNLGVHMGILDQKQQPWLPLQLVAGRYLSCHSAYLVERQDMGVGSSSADAACAPGTVLAVAVKIRSGRLGCDVGNESVEKVRLWVLQRLDVVLNLDIHPECVLAHDHVGPAQAAGIAHTPSFVLCSPRFVSRRRAVMRKSFKAQNVGCVARRRMSA